MRDLPAFAAPVGDASGPQRRADARGIAPDQRRWRRNRALRQIPVPDAVQVQSRRPVQAVIGLGIIAALVVLVPGMQRLVQIADEVDQEGKRLYPVFQRCALVLEQRNIARDLRRHAIAVLARRGQVERAANADVLIVPRISEAEARLAVGILQRLDAIRPHARIGHGRCLALGRAEQVGSGQQRPDRDPRLGPHIGLGDLRDRLMAIFPIGSSGGGSRDERDGEQSGEGANHDLAPTRVVISAEAATLFVAEHRNRSRAI